MPIKVCNGHTALFLMKYVLTHVRQKKIMEFKPPSACGSSRQHTLASTSTISRSGDARRERANAVMVWWPTASPPRAGRSTRTLLSPTCHMVTSRPWRRTCQVILIFYNPNRHWMKSCTVNLFCLLLLSQYLSVFVLRNPLTNSFCLLLPLLSSQYASKRICTLRIGFCIW